MLHIVFQMERGTFLAVPFDPPRIPHFFVSTMYRLKFIRSPAVALRNAAKPTTVVRQMSMITPRSFSCLSYGVSSAQTRLMQKRFFSSEMLTAKEMKEKIDACGINDAGKEKIIAEEIKKKNFAAVRDLAEK